MSKRYMYIIAEARINTEDEGKPLHKLSELIDTTDQLSTQCYSVDSVNIDFVEVADWRFISWYIKEFGDASLMLEATSERDRYIYFEIKEEAVFLLKLFLGGGTVQLEKEMALDYLTVGFHDSTGDRNQAEGETKVLDILENQCYKF